MAVPAALAGEYTNNGALTHSMLLGLEVRNQAEFDTCYQHKNWCSVASGWVEYEEDSWTLSGDDVVLNDYGLPNNVPSGKEHKCALQNIWSSYVGRGGVNDGTYPKGKYILTYDGYVDTIEVLGDGVTVLSETIGRIEFLSDSSDSITLKIKGTIHDTLRNFVCEEEKYEGDFARGDYWYPGFLNELRGFPVLEFEAWDICPAWPTTNTPYPTWAQIRDKEWFGYYDNPYYSNSLSYHVAGKDFRHMPYELQVDLCNKLEIDPWITIPYWASDSFVTSLATYWTNRLHKGATIYIEYAGEPFFSGSAASPSTQGAKYLYDTGVANGDTPPQPTAYCSRAEEVFALFKASSNHTVNAAVTSGTTDGGYLCADWIDTIKSTYNSGDMASVDHWSTSIYIGGQITPASGGLNHTWNWWRDTGTYEDFNDEINDAIDAKVTALDTLKTNISSTGLPLGMYEFGFSAAVDDYWSESDTVKQEADAIGDKLRAAYESEDEHWRCTYLLNKLREICDAVVIWYCSSTARYNPVPWGLADNNLTLKTFAQSSSDVPDSDDPRYYAVKEFVRGERIGIAVTDTNILRSPGRLVASPQDLTLSFPYGGVTVGRTKLVALQPIGERLVVPSEGIGGAGDILEGEHRYALSCFLRGWTDRAIEYLWSDAYTEGSVTGHAVFSIPGTVQTGESVGPRSVCLLYVPDDTLHAPALLLYNASANWMSGAEVALQRPEEFGLPIAFDCTKDAYGRVLTIGLIDDLSL